MKKTKTLKIENVYVIFDIECPSCGDKKHIISPYLGDKIPISHYCGVEKKGGRKCNTIIKYRLIKKENKIILQIKKDKWSKKTNDKER